jgi:S4 domain protein YaaA
MKERDLMENIKIKTEYITLGQLLKLTRLAYSGGIVKAFLEEHKISVNDVSENRRGKKLYPGDKVTIKKFGEYRITK